MTRLSIRPLAVLIGMLGVALMATHPGLVYAQAHVTLAAQQATPGTGLGDLLADPGTWATTMFNNALLKLGEKATSDVVRFMGWLLGNGNLISQTPPGLSYGNDAVIALWQTMQKVANAGLGVVTVWGGVNLMTRATSTLTGTDGRCHPRSKTDSLACRERTRVPTW